MRRTLLLTTAFGAVLLLGGGRSYACPGQQEADQGLILAQASGTNLGTPQMQPRPGGGVDAGPGAPTPAVPGTPGSSQVERRGAPPPGAGAPAPGGDPTAGGGGGGNLAPSGAIRPGAPGTGGQGSKGGP